MREVELDVSCASRPALMSLMRASSLELDNKGYSESPSSGVYENSPRGTVGPEFLTHTTACC